MKIFFQIIFFLSVLITLPAWAKTQKDLELVVDSLQRTLDAQSRNLATAMNQMQEILNEFQKMHGQVDQSSYQSGEQSRVLTDSQRRLEVLEDKVGLMVSQFEEIKNAGLVTPGQTSQWKEFQSYSRGLTLFNANQFKAAIQSFKDFMTQNPKSNYLANAQYWIGESLYAMQDYPAAVVEFQKIVQKFPKNAKAGAAFLKQGLAFFNMQSFVEAKAFLTKLISLYPNTTEAINAQTVIEKINHLLELKAKEAVEQKVLQ